jgi:hypothetical protein
MSSLRQALKEWAVICRALALGRQAILLRKGGIAEETGIFQLEHTRFWLFPTQVHQQREGITDEARPLLQEVELEQPAPGTVTLTHFAEVQGMYWIEDVAAALRLIGLHCWSVATVASRFAYRRPGLAVVPVRVYRAADACSVTVTAAQTGCKSWVELEEGLSTQGATPVLEDEAFTEVLRTLDRLLEPTALA